MAQPSNLRWFIPILPVQPLIAGKYGGAADLETGPGVDVPEEFDKRRHLGQALPELQTLGDRFFVRLCSFGK